MDKKLMNFSCPFTWDMEEVIETREKLLETKNRTAEMIEDLEDVFLHLPIIYQLMLAYENVMNDDPQTALQCVNKADEILPDVEKKSDTYKDVERVLKHIVDSSKCHVLQKLGRSLEIDGLMTKICDVDDMTEKELAMLNACQSHAWSLYHVTDNMKAINHIKKAVELDPRNENYHYLLGKNYRRLRRRHEAVYQDPDENEIEAFKNAYELSHNALFGVGLARMYRESKNENMAIKIYREVYELQPTSSIVRLQLALGFIRLRDWMLAKRCLDYVGKKTPDSETYMHYMGIYEDKCNKNSEAALPHYEMATKKGNFGAEWQYLRCKKRLDRRWNPLPYLLDMLNRYEKSSKHVIQDIKIQIGLHFLIVKNDFRRGCRHLIDAVKIQPDGYQLKKYYPLCSPVMLNVYDILEKRVRIFLTLHQTHPKDLELCNEALELCRSNNRG